MEKLMKTNGLYLMLCCTILIQLSCNKATIVYREQDRINGTDVRISKGAERGIYYAITDITTKSTGKRQAIVCECLDSPAKTTIQLRKGIYHEDGKVGIIWGDAWAKENPHLSYIISKAEVVPFSELEQKYYQLMLKALPSVCAQRNTLHYTGFYAKLKSDTTRQE